MQNKRPDPHKEKTPKKNLISVSIIQVQSTRICQGNSSYFSESGTFLPSSARYLHSHKLHPTLISPATFSANYIELLYRPTNVNENDLNDQTNLKKPDVAHLMA